MKYISIFRHHKITYITVPKYTCITGCQKLGIGSPHRMKLFLEDGFEVDSDEILCSDLTKSGVLMISGSGYCPSNGKSVQK